MKNKTILKAFRFLTLLCFMCLGTNAWGQTVEYEELFTVKSDDVVTNSSYTKYQTTVEKRDWIITFGGNNKSVGTNSGNRSKCNLSSYTKYAVSPVTTSDVASAFVSLTRIDDVSKISYTFNGGSNQTKTKVYLIYSADGETFSQIKLTSGTQGADISSETSFTFAKCSGYFGLLCKATNSSGNWRIDDVNITFYKTKAPTKTLKSIAVSGTPTKTEYQAGEALDPAGLVVTGTYDDSSTETITEGITWTFEPETLSAGTTSCTVTATVDEITSPTYTVNDLTVTSAKTLTGIEVSGEYQTEFWKGQTFTHEGAIVNATWDDKSKTDVTSESEFTTPDMTTVGEKTVTITYKGEETSYNINVKSIVNTAETAYTVAQARAIIDANVPELSTASVFVSGIVSEIPTPWSEQYENITYNITDDGTTTSPMFQLFRCATDGAAVGDKVIAQGTLTLYGSTYEFKQGNTISSIINPEITALTISGTPTKTTYEDGDALNPEGLVVTATYNFGQNKVVTEDVEWTFDPETLSTGTTSCDVMANIDAILSDVYTVTGLTVNAPRVLTSVVVSGTPTKNVYTVGDVFEPAGLTVTANYSIGDPVDVTSEAEFTYSTEPLAFGTTSIDVTATYNETESAVFACPITVNKKEAAITIADIEIGIGATVTVSATTTPEEAELTYSITSGSEFITLNGDEITGVAAGTAVVNAHFDGNEEYAAADKSFNVVVSNVTKDKLVASMFAATSTTYTDFSDVTAISPAVYAGNNGKTSDGGIQLRSKNSTSGIISTTSGGFVKQVSIVVESGTNTVDVYGKNTPYESVSELYSSSAATQGTKLGSLSATGVIDVTGDYAYIGIRSYNGALFLTSIEIAWEAPKTHTVTVSSACETEGTEGLTTMFVDYATEIPADCKAYYVSAANEGTLTLTKCDKYVAANQGVLVWGAKGDSFTFTQTGITVEAPATNLLIGAVEDGTQVCSEGDGIYYLATTGSFKELDGRVMKANKAYLNLGTPGIKEFTFVIDGETGIEEIHNAEFTIHNDGKYLEKGKIVIVKNNAKYNVAGQMIK